MNIEIHPDMMKWRDVIDKYMGGPMFYVFDNELVNMYQYLSRLSDSELSGVCKDPKFAKMCDTVIGERSSNFGEFSGFVNERGMLNIEGLLPILSSFPSFNDAMNFIMRIKPGFRYTPQFKDFVEENIQIEQVDNGIFITNTYTLGDYRYITQHSIDLYIVEYRKLIDGEWELHRINGPANIELHTNLLLLEWYREGDLYQVDDKYYNVVYHGVEWEYDYVDYNSENVENIVELPYNITKNSLGRDGTKTTYYYNNEYNFAYDIKSKPELRTTDKYIHDPLFDTYRLVEKYVNRGHGLDVCRYLYIYNVNGLIAFEEKNCRLNSSFTYYNPDGSVRSIE